MGFGVRGLGFRGLGFGAVKGWALENKDSGLRFVCVLGLGQLEVGLWGSRFVYGLYVSWV